MFNIPKNLLIGIAAAIIVIAMGASACSASAPLEANPIATSETATPDNGRGPENGSSGIVPPVLDTSNEGATRGPGENGNQGSTSSTVGSGIPQANTTGASTVHGIVSSYDAIGMSLTLDDGTSLYVQLGSPRYCQSIGFAPAVGEAVTVNGFPDNQGLYSAISITVDSSGQTYSFRDENGRPLWAGGNGAGEGGRP